MMKAVTIGQLNRYVKSVLDGDGNLQGLMLVGEISNFTNHYASGHLYFTLKDEQAAVKAVMFRSQAMQLPFLPENGMKVIARARVSLYEKDGSFQVYVDQMQPDGAGALQVAFEQLKMKLQKEGLFDLSRKKPLPLFPERIGVITSPTGAAVRDIVTVLERRYPCAQILLNPVLVQGVNAPADLQRALLQFETMKQNNASDTPDVIIIGRGGGSLEELWAFNDEGLARTIAACTIPVISAVGHETDFTICDFVADIRAATPSAAAELAVPDQEDVLRRLGVLSRQLSSLLSAVVQQKKHSLQTLAQRPCLSKPLYYVEERAMRLDMITRSFTAAVQATVSRHQTQLATLTGKLDAMSPLRVIARGYAVMTDVSGAIVTAHSVKPGEPLMARVCDGTIECRVESVSKKEDVTDE